MKPKHVIRVLLVMLLVGSMFAAFFAWQYQMPSKVIVWVDDVAITQHDLSLRLRELLWRQGKNWDHLSPEEQSSLQLEATNALIDGQLIKEWAATHPANVGAATIEYDFQQFLKQFESPEGWKERMTLQGLNEPQLRERLALETKQHAALESYLTGNSRVSEAEAQSWFKDHQQELLIPECVRASHIFLSGHDKEKPDRTTEMSAIYQKLLSKKAAFNELATKPSEDDRSNKKGGDLGWFTRERVPKEFAETVFSMSQNEMSKPFQTTLGWHIVWVQDRHEKRIAEFAEVQSEITVMLESRKRETLRKDLIQGLRQKGRILRNKVLIQLARPPLQLPSS